MLGKHVLAPKEKTSLLITFDTEGSPGPFRKRVTLTTDIPGQDELEVTIEGAVKEAPCAKIQVTPRRVDLGAVSSLEMKTQSFTIANTGSLPLVITKISVKGKDVLIHDAHKQGNLVIAPGGTGSFEYAVRPDKGDHEETIAIESNAKNASKGEFAVIVRYSGN